MKFCRGELKHRAVQLHGGLDGHENMLVWCEDCGALIQGNSFLPGCKGGTLVLRGSGLVDQNDA